MRIHARNIRGVIHPCRQIQVDIWFKIGFFSQWVRSYEDWRGKYSYCHHPWKLGVMGVGVVTTPGSWEWRCFTTLGSWGWYWWWIWGSRHLAIVSFLSLLLLHVVVDVVLWCCFYYCCEFVVWWCVVVSVRIMMVKFCKGDVCFAVFSLPFWWTTTVVSRWLPYPPLCFNLVISPAVPLYVFLCGVAPSPPILYWTWCGWGRLYMICRFIAGAVVIIFLLEVVRIVVLLLRRWCRCFCWYVVVVDGDNEVVIVMGGVGTVAIFCNRWGLFPTPFAFTILTFIYPALALFHDSPFWFLVIFLF